MPIQDPLTELIIGCCFRVANELGPGFLEKVYENALTHELRKARLNVVQQQGIEVFYDGVNVGNNEADLLVEGRVLVEVKARHRERSCYCFSRRTSVPRRLGDKFFAGFPAMLVQRGDFQKLLRNCLSPRSDDASPHLDR